MIDEVEVEGFMSIVVNGIKVVEFVRFKADILDKEAVALEDIFNVDFEEIGFEEVDEVLDVDEIAEDLEVDEVMMTVPKVPIPLGRDFVGEAVVTVEAFVDPRTRVW